MQFPCQSSSLYRGESKRFNKPRGGRHHLTQQKKQEIKEAFELFDTDGSGYIHFTIKITLTIVEFMCVCACV